MIALEPTSQAVRLARVCAAQLLDQHTSNVRDNAVLLISEIVSNAIQHGGPFAPDATIGLVVETTSQLIRVEVSDPGSGIPSIPTLGARRIGGVGMLLVQMLSSRWGWSDLDVGKTVWFEIDLDNDWGVETEHTPDELVRRSTQMHQNLLPAIDDVRRPDGSIETAVGMSLK